MQDYAASSKTPRKSSCSEASVANRPRRASVHGRRLGALLVIGAMTLAFAAHGNQHPPSVTRSPRGHSSERVLYLRTPGPKQVLIRGGHFTMGSSDTTIRTALALCRSGGAAARCDLREYVNEGPERVVHLTPYWLDRTEVSNGAYQRCIDAGVCPPARYQAARSWRRRADLPVTLISWREASAYCHWSGGHLPTEAQWERAARGLTGRRFPWGTVYHPLLANHGRSGRRAHDDRDGFVELAPIDDLYDGRSAEGILQLAGNVEEWVADWYAPRYPAADEIDPKGPPRGDTRIVRGGSFIHGASRLRSASRRHDLPTARRAWRGFRCARSHRSGPPHRRVKP